MEVAEIKKIMKEKKISYERLSALTGLSLGGIRKIMCGYTKKPKYETMQLILKAIDEEDDFKSDLSRNYITTDEEYILRTFRSLSARDKELFLGVVGNFDRPVSELKSPRKHKA